jgi:hypothetical protein
MRNFITFLIAMAFWDSSNAQELNAQVIVNSDLGQSNQSTNFQNLGALFE